MKKILYLHAVETVGPFAEYPPEVLSQWRTNFQPNAARRMTPLGLMLGEATKNLLNSTEPAVIYATSYSEVSTLEKYLGSFPTPSPLYFQTCIHPGGIEQVLVQKQCSVKFLLPLAGEQAIVGQAIAAAVASGAISVLFCGGEELSQWLGTVSVASKKAFAFALRLNAGEDRALGSLEWAEYQGGESASLLQFFMAIADREDCLFGWPDVGSVHLKWR